MKLLLTLGKALILTLWLALAGSLLQPLSKPFDLLLPACGALLLFAHLLALVLFGRGVKAGPLCWKNCLQVLLFGILHLYAPPKDSQA